MLCLLIVLPKGSIMSGISSSSVTEKHNVIIHCSTDSKFWFRTSCTDTLTQRLILTIFCVCVLQTTLCNTVPTISVMPNDAFDLQKTECQLIEHICSVYININKTVLFILTKQRFSTLTSSPGQEEILCMFLIETNLYLFSC